MQQENEIFLISLPQFKVLELIIPKYIFFVKISCFVNKFILFYIIITDRVFKSRTEGESEYEKNISCDFRYHANEY